MIYIYEGILSVGATMTLLGEEQFGQEGINFGFNLVGDKDSTRFEVYSSRKESVKPFSVVCHHETSSWWIVSKDKVERYTNEQGWLYKHSLQCVGAIELLNARDLINCGFNQGKYTLQEFITRLFSLSNFEFNTLNTNLSINTHNNIDINQKVDYIKTFENYTLLSALRELLDGYNQCVKLNFTRNLTYNQITGCELVIMPKTGDISLSVLDMDNVFNNVQEQRNMNKNSYGTIVVSNVDNAVSSMAKTYPNVGGAKLSANDYQITPNNAVVRLPSNAFYVEEVDVCMSIKIGISFRENGSWGQDGYEQQQTNTYNVANDLNPMLDEIKASILAHYSTNFDETDFENHRQEMIENLKKGGTIQFKQGAIFNPSNNTFTYKDNSYTIKYGYLFHGFVLGLPQYYKGQIALFDEESANGTHNPWNCIKWKRGSNEISSFGWISYDKNSTTEPSDGGRCYIPASQTMYGTRCIIYEWAYSGYSFDRARIQIVYSTQSGYITDQVAETNPCLLINNFTHQSQVMWGEGNATFRVKYIPMTDLKIMLDNNEENRHVQLYNQNGKLTDTIAFSKLLNSYKTEIENENIVKYHTCYELFTLGTTTFNTLNCPKLGQIVLDSNNDQYIINSVSYNLYQNEPNSYEDSGSNYTQYYVECEYSLSKNVATKSLMTNPNTNIRDYGIPQKYNVKRTHVRRDFWELDHSDTPHTELSTLDISKVMNVGNMPKPYNQHTALMKISYDHEVNGSDSYYYQLESTTYMLKKAIIECVEFQDNNIIGYDCQNVVSGFSIQRVLSGMNDLKSTPISYTDENGNFKSINIYMSNTDQMENIYAEYIEDNEIITDLPIQDMMIFIDQDIYDYAYYYTSNRDYYMTFSNYNKDALEVPVFEYCTQVDDTSDVIIGENVLSNSSEDFMYFYSYVLVQKGVANNNNWTALTLPSISLSLNNDSQLIISSTNIAYMEYGTHKINIELYGNMAYNTDTNELTKSNKESLTDIDNYDIAIIRRTMRYAIENTRISENTTTGHIDPQDFVPYQYGYEYSTYEQIDTTNINANSIRVVRVYADTNIQNLNVGATFDSANSRFNVLARVQQQPSASDYLDIYIEYSYETTNGTYTNTNNDLMFVIRHTENANIENDTISLSINNWHLN